MKGMEREGRNQRRVVNSENARSSSKSSAKRPAVENGGKAPPVSALQQAKKRAALVNLTNQGNVAANSKASQSSLKSEDLIEVATSKAKTTSINLRNASSQRLNPVTASVPKQPGLPQHANKQNLLRNNEACSRKVALHAVRSPSGSDGGSESMDESMSTSESSGPEVEYSNNSSAAAVASLERRTSQNLHITEHSSLKPRQGHLFEEYSSAPVKFNELQFIDVDTEHMNPQMCTTYACDIDQHLRNAETKKRPAANYMEEIQEDINASMRGILIDWLVEVAEEYKLVPDTLYLTVTYIDRYLSKNVVNRQRLQLLGVTCMLVASKYEEICAPQVEEFCYITDNTYFRDEVLQMESKVLQHLNFELSTPTIKCFLRRFVRAAQASLEAQLLHLEFLANFLAELTLPDYSFLEYLPSLLAASAVFLAKFTLDPIKKPWTPTLKHYTRYQPRELKACVKALHELQCNKEGCGLPAIREKYRQHKFKCVSTMVPPAIIPAEFFSDI
ncbi:cyclin-A1-4 isoform X2 [Cryptomeria japonica]|uniref:cyclin-A1-4 isoform X2 n=1 Tax=Cryptomeria japonica TaxID=3369 RepID=UPI0027DAAB77|nr:cyclin-A1-4 isoform X2 [Cryptomeria japonica]